MFYGDTSLLVAALTHEASTAAAQAWLDVHPLATSGWVHVELCNAIAMNQRTGKLAAAATARVLAQWQQVRQSLLNVPVSPAHFDIAASLIARSTVGLRSGDALHATLAHQSGHVLATLDRRLLRACAELEIAAVDPLA